MTGVSDVSFCDVALLNFGLVSTLVRAALPERWIEPSRLEVAEKSVILLNELDVELWRIKALAGEQKVLLCVECIVSCHC